MAQEFTINSAEIETKINQLLPSQGGFGAGVDFSASTMVIPIIDLTETAEGSGLREDLQKSLSLTNISSFAIFNTSTTIINTTGYYRIFGVASTNTSGTLEMSVTDGITATKRLLLYNGGTVTQNNQFDFMVFLAAGESIVAQSSASSAIWYVTTRQIADISGNLVNPT